MKISVIWSWSRWLALSDVLAYNGNNVLVYARDPERAKEINIHHTAQKYLWDIIFDKKIKANSNLKEVLNFSNYLITAVPSKSIISILKEIKSTKPSDNYFFINATKWFANKKTIQQTINEYFPIHRWLVSVLWPWFAKELINKNITCVCSVSSNEKEALFVQALFSNNYFRVYTQSDVIWAEIYSAIKNAIAITSWIISWLWYDWINTKSSLITQWLREMSIIWKILWAKEETFFWLTWLWDLILTCSSNESRNFQAWYQIWKENSAENFLKKNKKTVEWLTTVWVVEWIAKKYNLELPILHSLYLTIYENAKPSDMLKAIMQRPPTDETLLYKQIKDIT
jgi:glycerol-3-phosphate dehydrogenase (NAD(P)+)